LGLVRTLLDNPLATSAAQGHDKRKQKTETHSHGAHKLLLLVVLANQSITKFWALRIPRIGRGAE
jgi:hypothetical protein